jgi:uncharacterized protein YecE (DUF72 family)
MGIRRHSCADPSGLAKMSESRPEFRVGTSGYQYDHWKGVFYPAGLAKSRWLDYYSGHFDTVEINNSFYHLPPESSFDQWRKQAPPGFVYALKFSRYATHMRKLKDPAEPIKRFLGVAEKLSNHLGPILAQLPPRWRANPGRLSDFLRAVPASRRWALEFRNRTWLCEEVYAILRKHNAALCVHDLIENHPAPVTADWIYMRFHGTAGHAGNYSTRQIKTEAEKICELLAQGLDVFVYFNNDVHGYALANALELRRFVGKMRGEQEQDLHDFPVSHTMLCRIDWRRTQVAKGEVCKTSMQRFESARRLHLHPQLPGVGPQLVKQNKEFNIYNRDQNGLWIQISRAYFASSVYTIQKWIVKELPSWLSAYGREESRKPNYTMMPG